MRHFTRFLVFCSLWLVLGGPGLADPPFSFKQIGSVTGDSGTLTLWTVENTPYGKAVVVRVQNTGKAGESNVALLKDGLNQFKQLCQQAMEHRGPLSKGQLLLIGTVKSGENRIDVAVARPDAATVRILVAHEGAKEHNFVIDSHSARALYKLLDKGRDLLP